MTHATHAAALAAFLQTELENITESDWTTYGLPTFKVGGEEWAVGTDSEADRAAMEYIEGSIWAFKPEFILAECGLPFELSEAIGAFQSEKCEDANDALLALVEKCCKGGIEAFAESAVSADGRGHFLSGHDGEENEQEHEGQTFFLYRTN